VKIEVVPFRQVTSDVRKRWSELCNGSIAPFDSPFYRPEFSDVIDRSRGDVEVGIVESASKIVALLPFHRQRGVGHPVGLHLNDFQGFVGELPEECSLEQALKGFRLTAFDFDHVPIQQLGSRFNDGLSDPSTFIDLSGGWEAYQRVLSERPNDSRDTSRRRRKLERERGEVRFEHNSADPCVLEKLLCWKRDQFVRTSVPDVLEEAWVRKAVDLMFERRELPFGGLVSGIWAGENLIAAQMGLRSANVHHLQWCAYDRDFHPYAPGRLLNESFIQWSAENGISRIEFGKGNEDYKLRAATGQHLLATGSVTCSPLQRAIRGSWWAMRRWARSSPLRRHLKSAATYYYRLRKRPQVLAKEAG
jgi:CelD/BcsL family acetyltransferase involved in cellulose biosynthesis